MNIAKSLYSSLPNETYFQSHVPAVVYNEWVRIKDINGRTSKSVLLESMMDFIGKHDGQTDFDIFTKFD